MAPPLCSDCLERFTSGYSLRLGQQVLVAGPYRGGLRKAVLRLKEANDQRLVQILADWLAKIMQTHGVRPVSAVAAVPTAVRRRKWRGYCAPERVAQALAGKLACPRVSQFTCQGDPRPRKFLKGYKIRRAGHLPDFVCSEPLRGSVLLLDDVVTSGTTLMQAREALLAAGAETVHLLAIAG